MLHLLRLEWKKLATHRLFLITAGLFLVLLPLLYMTVKSGTNLDSDSNNPMLAIYQSFYKFPGIWDTMTYLSSWLTYFLLTYLVMSSVTSEANNKTLRQNLITGMSRNEWLSAKVLMLLVMVVGVMLYTTVVTLLFGSFAGGYGKPFTLDMVAVGRLGIQSFFYGSFGLLLALVFRRGGLALMVFFAYTLIIERIIRYLLFGNVLNNLEVGSYLPSNLAWDTVPFFMAKRIPSALDEDQVALILDPNIATLSLLVYTGLFLGLSYWIFNRRDL